MNNQAPDLAADMPTHEGALDFEQKEDFSWTIVQRFVVGLTLGDDQIGVLESPLELRAAGFKQRASPIGPIVDHFHQSEQPRNLRIHSQGVINGRTAFHSHSDVFPGQ
jgi:hypothetical protein